MGSAPSSPRNQISPLIVPGVGTRPITAKDVTDLPDPDSPTIPSLALMKLKGNVINGFDYIVVSKNSTCRLRTSKTVFIGVYKEINLKLTGF